MRQGDEWKTKFKRIAFIYSSIGYPNIKILIAQTSKSGSFLGRFKSPFKIIYFLLFKKA